MNARGRSYRQPALADLLNPKSVAIVGLSARRGSTGRRILDNLRAAGFGGAVYGVHPSGQDVDSVAVYRSLADVPDTPTVVLICTPGDTVPALVEQAGEKGCRGAVVYASGFEETADGAARADRLRDLAGHYGMSLVGPNCMGVFNPGRGLWLTGASYGADLRPGGVAVVSQSGSGCILLAGSGRLGFSYVVSSGNETVTGLADYLDYLVQDPSTRAVGIVVEGLGDAEGVMAAVRKGHANGVAVVALKVGRTELGARNVASHTGAIAGDARAYEAFCRRAGIVAVADFDEMTEALVALSTLRTGPSGDRVAFLGLSGGETGLVADVAADFGAHRDGGAVRLAEFSPGTREELARILPDFATIANPLDGTGQLVGEPERFGRLAAAVAGDQGVDLLAVVLDAPPSLGDRLATSYSRLLASLPEVRRSSGTPVMVLSNYGGGLHPFATEALAGSDIPVVHGTRAGMAAIAAVTTVAGHARGPAEGDARPAAMASDRSGATSLRAVRRALDASPVGQVSHEVLAELADRYELPLPRRVTVDSAVDAVAAAESIGFPVVLKTASPRVVHKSDVGGVAVGLSTPSRVREAYESVTSSVARHLGEAAPGVVVEEMVTGGVEAFVGCGLDPVFGQVLALGVGGTLVELQPDPALSLPPVSPPEVRRMVSGTPLARLFAGYRGAAPADADAFVDLVSRVARLAADLREAAVEIDLNPVAVLPRGQGVRVLDLRIVAAARPPAGAVSADCFEEIADLREEHAAVDYTSILYEVDEGVATITFNRPEVMNALSGDMERELHDALRRAGADPDARAIVLTGAGRAFCSGYDMGAPGGTSVSDPAKSYPAEFIATWYERNYEELDHLKEIWSLSKPVIAAVNGWCMGGGFWYSLASDITIASSDAVFAQPEVRMTSSSIFLFAALCGWKSANRYALTGDHFDAAEALRIGVVNEVVAPDELLPTAQKLGRRIALVPEASVRLNKAITMQGLRAAGIDSGLLLNGALNALAHSSYGPHRERLNEAKAEGGLRAFLNARDEPFRPEPFGPKSARPAE